MVSCSGNDVQTEWGDGCLCILMHTLNDTICCMRHWSNYVCLQVGLAVVNGQLMAVGGFDGTTYLKTIEVYDPDANTWR